MLLHKEQVHWFEDIGYHHPGYTHCPNKPEMQRNCICRTGKEFMYTGKCSRRLETVKNIDKSQALKLARLPDLV
ncbi:hypothetical protein GGI06_006141 [Coemansia sp. S85]|nr:hypothetical protein GGI06_006141 [Coemansia sp. S85]